MSLTVPIHGGVRDGDYLTVPQFAMEGYTVVLEGPKPPKKSESAVIQSTEYVLHGKPWTLVAKGLKWPIVRPEGSSQ